MMDDARVAALVPRIANPAARPEGSIVSSTTTESSPSCSWSNRKVDVVVVTSGGPQLVRSSPGSYATPLDVTGMAIDVAADGEEGWAKLHVTDYDVVALDRDLPLGRPSRRGGLVIVRLIYSTGSVVTVDGGSSAR